jgi:hypothetical protein
VKHRILQSAPCSSESDEIFCNQQGGISCSGKVQSIKAFSSSVTTKKTSQHRVINTLKMSSHAQKSTMTVALLGSTHKLCGKSNLALSFACRYKYLSIWIRCTLCSCAWDPIILLFCCCCCCCFIILEDQEEYYQESNYESQESYTRILPLNFDVDAPVTNTKRKSTNGNTMLEVTLYDIKSSSSIEDVIAAVDAYLMVFSIYVQASFSILEESIEQVFRVRGWDRTKKYPILLVNHIFSQDGDAERMVELTDREIKNLAFKWNIDVINVDSRAGYNVNLCFFKLAQLLYESRNQEAIKQKITRNRSGAVKKDHIKVNNNRFSWHVSLNFDNLKKIFNNLDDSDV